MHFPFQLCFPCLHESVCDPTNYIKLSWWSFCCIGCNIFCVSCDNCINGGVVCTETRFVCVNALGSCRKGAITNSHTHTVPFKTLLSFLSPCVRFVITLLQYTHCVSRLYFALPERFVIINNPAASIAFKWKENTRRFGWQNNRVGRICTLYAVCVRSVEWTSERASEWFTPRTHTHIAHVAAGRTLCWLPVLRWQL